jgi:hypothetical protein
MAEKIAKIQAEVTNESLTPQLAMTSLVGLGLPRAEALLRVREALYPRYADAA